MNENFKSVKGSASESTWTPTKDAEGIPRVEATDEDILVGYLVGQKDGVGKNSQTVYTVQDANGVKTDVWGTTVLNEQMDKIRPGQYICIQWLGKKLTKAGLTKYKSVKACTDPTMSFHDWEVGVDESTPPLTGTGVQAKPTQAAPVANGTGDKSTATNTAGSVGTGAAPFKDTDELPF